MVLASLLSVAIAAGSVATTPPATTAVFPPPSPSTDGVGNTPQAAKPANGWLLGATTLGVGASAMTVGAIAWWADYGLQPFSLRDAGWFGRRTYAGGGDKAGHFFGNYLGVHAMSGIYRSLGVSPRTALLYGAAFTFLMANGVEIIDGFTIHGYEYGDSVMNTLGLSLGVATELWPALGDVVGMRVAYVPSRGFVHGPKTYLKLINDYTGQLILADLKLGGLFQHLDLPTGVARFFLLSLSWGTDAYSPKGPRELRERNLGIHVGLSIPELLRALPLGAWARPLATTFSYFALPFTSVGLVRDLNHGRWSLSFGVANRFDIGL